MSEVLDPRLHAYRPDLAVRSLQGQVEAERFVDPEPGFVSVGRAALREEPSTEARQGSELLYGERLDLVEEKDDWCWVQNQTDGYVGYVARSAISSAAPRQPTHRVTALRSYLFAEPDLRLPPLDMLEMSSFVSVMAEQEGWAEIAGGGWLWSAHLSPLSDVQTDWLRSARRLIGASYYWGGRSTTGLDCSALIQLSLAMAGIDVARDSDQQEATLGLLVEGGVEKAEPGDVLYWPGHCAFWLGEGRILHANAHHMAVAEEPLSDFKARTLEKIGDVRMIRRPAARTD